jgi:hypothetical protein
MAAAIESLRRTGLRSAPSVMPRGGGATPLPLSFAQQRLWFVDQLEPGSAAYNVTKAVRISGPLDTGALRGAWQEIVRRHETLRTSLPAIDGEAEQHIAPPARVPIPLIDLTALPPRTRDAAARRLAIAEAGRGFTLSDGPLWRVSLLRLAPAAHVLVAVLHHAVSDGWSVGVIMREMAALYDALRHEAPSPLPDLPVQYADFARWQRAWLTGDVWQQQLDYWQRQLTGLEPLALPTDFARGTHLAAPGGQIFFTLEPDAGLALRTLAGREGVTVFMVLLAAFQWLLGRWSGQHDIAVLTDVANRTRTEIEGLIGFFVNQLVMRTDLSDATTFRALLARVRETALDAYAHQDLPFDALVEALSPSRDSRAPLVSVKLVLQNAPTAALALTGTTVTDIRVAGVDAKLDLLLLVDATGDEVRGCLEYDASLFTHARVLLFLTQYTALLRGACAAPTALLAALHLVSDEEYRRITSAFS